MSKAHPVAHVRLDHITLTDVANLYLDQLYHRAKAAQIGWGHYNSCKHRLRRIAEAIGPEFPLAQIGKQELLGAVLYFAKRPPCKPRAFQKRPAGEPISLVTAKECISTIRALFVWVADHDLLHWDRPRGFERLFKLKERRLKTAEEEARDAIRLVTGEVDTFTTEELNRLFRASTSRERLYILLGLNCGFTSGEISSLRTFEVLLDAERPFIHKRRAKTGIEAKWLLWPETAAILRRHRARANPGLKWILTQQDNPLVEVRETGRRDAIDQAWSSLVPRSGIGRWLGFRFLRKTGANAVKRLGGLEESEMYLAHQEPGLNKNYANRNWDKMWACLGRFREQLPFLGPAWEIDPSECLFTQNGNPEWAEVNPPWVQKVNKRNETGILNVSLNKRKGKFYARVYRAGRTHSKGYFETAEAAAVQAGKIRARLEAGAALGRAA